MKQEDKELLLKDLSARLPYGVYGLITFHKTMGENSTFKSVVDGKLYDRFANLQDSWYDNIPSIKPYLRPMPSMTEEEKEDFELIREWSGELNGIGGYYVEVDDASKYIDFLNSHQFDYRGLIEKGLALEAPEGMYQ